MNLTYTPFGTFPLSTLHSNSNVFMPNKPNHLTQGSQQIPYTSSHTDIPGSCIEQVTSI